MAETKKPFSVKVQDLVYNVEVGLGLRIVQGVLYALLILGLMVGFTAKRFAGLKDAEAMDQAQLARNLMEKHQLVTQNIRPASMWYLIEKSRQHSPQMEQHPDIVNPPLYPAILSVGFLATRGAFASESIAGVFTPEQWIIVPIGHLCTVLSGLLVYLLGRRLFDARHGFWAMTVFYLSATVWGLSVSGLNISLLMLECLGAWYFALAAVERRLTPEESRGSTGLLLLSLLCAIAAVHTRYIGVVIAPAVALFIGLALRQRNGWRLMTVYLILFTLAMVPWLTRNIIVSGGPLGLAPYLALNGSKVFEGDTFERMLAPLLSGVRIFHTLASKWATNFGVLYDSGVRGLGEGLFICFYIASFFFRFSKPLVNLFQWCLGGGLLLFLVLAPLGSEVTQRALAIFWPLTIVYGCAFFFILLHRLQFQLRILNQGLTLLVVLLTALPLFMLLVPAKVGPPYPPYYPPFIKHVTTLVRPGELLCTDMAWATAWYGRRDSLLLPLSMDEFYAINDQPRFPAQQHGPVVPDRPHTMG
ncbi:MAG: glycosyltransferase family 39 protein [Kiritimatiellaeota bacterium]|nr:glycosyltransferase family 39 protein [Kiritimatiellota bacterium]